MAQAVIDAAINTKMRQTRNKTFAKTAKKLYLDSQRANAFETKQLYRLTQGHFEVFSSIFVWISG
jgi:hypothetical protein